MLRGKQFTKKVLYSNIKSINQNWLRNKIEKNRPNKKLYRLHLFTIKLNFSFDNLKFAFPY